MLVTLILAAALLLRLGTGVLAVLEPDAPDSNAGIDGAVNEAEVLVDLEAIRQLRLFDESGVAGEPDRAVPAAETLRVSALNLTLDGVMLAAGDLASYAVISGPRGQRMYRQGEAIDAGLTLERIEQDRVVINNSGIREAVWLDSGTGSGRDGRARHLQGTVAAQGGSVEAELREAVIKGEISTAVATLSEIMQVVPENADGALVGYRISPGEKLREFVRLGFHSGDVLTEVNGIPLNDPARIPELYRLMNQATEVSFSLIREGEPRRLSISLQAPATPGK